MNNFQVTSFGSADKNIIGKTDSDKNSFNVIESLEMSEKMRTYLSATEKELIDERDTVKKFL